jgi:hypothetical protein
MTISIRTPTDPATHVTDASRATRLAEAVHYLRYDVPRLLDGAKFDLRLYATVTEPDRLPIHDVRSVTLQNASRCGFVGCAAGWLALHPGMPVELPLGIIVGTYRLAAWFGISEEAAGYVFGSAFMNVLRGKLTRGKKGKPIIPNTPRAAAGRIERFLLAAGVIEHPVKKGDFPSVIRTEGRP